MKDELKNKSLGDIAIRAEQIGFTGGSPQAFADLAAIVAELARRMEAPKAEADK